MKYIYTHLGLGDQIICNGLVRYLCELHKCVSVFCKSKNYPNIQYMYRDNPNIIVIPLIDDFNVDFFIRKNNLEKDTYRIGFEKGHKFVVEEKLKFDESFYRCVNIPFEYRFTKFFILRDVEKENQIFNLLNPNNEKYIFTHDVDLNRIRKDLMIIKNPIQFNIFDILGLIERAEEVHLMESSLKCLVGSIKMNKPKFFHHRYVRGYNHDSLSINTFINID